MAKKFQNAAKLISGVAKKTNQQAKVVTLKMISDNNLIDYPNNREDIKQTSDLETSIKENGFTDPIEITDFGMENGKYMILSGHRRRAAGRKLEMEVFPCILKSFSNENEVKNYVLMANSQRDSDTDPLLRARRYKMHEEYLNSIGFQGSYREEIAKRMNLSTQQADRYKAFSKIISPVWDMVQFEQVSMTSVMPMAAHSEAEQGEILKIINECLFKGDSLTVKKCKDIIDGYRRGARSYSEILPHDEEVLEEKSLDEESENDLSNDNFIYDQHLFDDLEEEASHDEELQADPDIADEDEPGKVSDDNTNDFDIDHKKVLEDKKTPHDEEDIITNQYKYSDSKERLPHDEEVEEKARRKRRENQIHNREKIKQALDEIIRNTEILRDEYSFEDEDEELINKIKSAVDVLKDELRLD